MARGKGRTIFWTIVCTIVLIGAAAVGINTYRQSTCEHEYGEGKVVKEATCTEDGEIEYECDKCWKVKTENIPATGHTALQLDAIPATCTSTGLHAGEVCEVCEKVLIEQEVIPVLGHNLETVAGQEATCTESGYYTYEVCADCGYTENYVEIPATGHNLETVAGQAATCTEIGWNEYYRCTACGDTQGYVELPEAHDYVFGANNSHTYNCTYCGELQYWTVTFKLDDEIIGTSAYAYGQQPKSYPTLPDDLVCTSSAWVFEDTGAVLSPYESIWRTGDVVLVYKNEHLLIEMAGQPSSCVAGWGDYQQCQYCGEKFGYVEIPATECYYDPLYQYKCVGCGEYKTWTATYMVDDEVYLATEFSFGSEAEYPEDPVKAGYSFIGWYYTGTDTIYEKHYSLWVTEDVVFEARFESLTASLVEAELVDGETAVGNWYRLYDVDPTEEFYNWCWGFSITAKDSDGNDVTINVSSIGCTNSGYGIMSTELPFTSVVYGDGYTDILVEECTFTIDNASLSSPITVTIDDTSTIKLTTNSNYYEAAYKLVEA